MSVGSVPGASATLQKQLLHDQKTFATDRTGKASPQVLAMDQARVTLDQASLAAADARQVQQAKPAQAITAPSAPAAGNASSRGVNLYL